jgi:hypothetical protein
MKIMTHGGITDIVREIRIALGFESGESWSEDQVLQVSAYQGEQNISLNARPYPFLDPFALTLRECACPTLVSK